MFYYHAKTFQSATIGKRFKPVVCDNCGCEFCYELTRIGWGSGSAPYGLGAAAAQRSSVEKSQRDLAARLQGEAEMVPCPQCNWVNDELTLGFRRSRYRNWGTLAAFIGILGTVSSLVYAYILATGPARNRAEAKYLLIVGPALSIALALFITGLRNMLRSRIRPNDSHPQPPKLPIGSPAPLVLSQTTGQLEFARPPGVPDDGAGNWVYFFIGRGRLPPVCCGCLAATGPGATLRKTVLPAVALTIPCCGSCAEQWKQRKWRIGLIAFTIALTLMLGSLVAIRNPRTEFWLLAGAACLIAAGVGAAAGQYATTPVRVKVVDRSRGIIRLWFRNGQYARQAATGGAGAIETV